MSKFILYDILLDVYGTRKGMHTFGGKVGKIIRQKYSDLHPNESLSRRKLDIHGTFFAWVVEYPEDFKPIAIQIIEAEFEEHKKKIAESKQKTKLAKNQKAKGETPPKKKPEKTNKKSSTDSIQSQSKQKTKLAKSQKTKGKIPPKKKPEKTDKKDSTDLTQSQSNQKINQSQAEIRRNARKKARERARQRAS